MGLLVGEGSHGGCGKWKGVAVESVVCRGSAGGRRVVRTGLVAEEEEGAMAMRGLDCATVERAVMA